MKIILINSLAVFFLFSLAGCEKNKNLDTFGQEQNTTSPHSLQNEPVDTDHLTDNNQLHDDPNINASTPALIENGASNVMDGKSTSSLSSRTKPN